MTQKIRLVRTMVTEYEPIPEYYDEGATIEEMAEMDATSDGLEFVFTELESDDVEWMIVDESGKVLATDKKYRTHFKNGELIIDFIGDIGSYWREGRICIDINGLSLDKVNQKVKSVVQENLV